MGKIAEDYPVSAVRDDRVPKDVYFSEDFQRHEAEYLWPRTWQIVCRLEEIPKVGDYVTYDILSDSIVVTRASETEVKAYHNACPHRGRTLTQGCGNAKQFVCKFHGWRFDLDGCNTKVVDRDDWGTCLSADDASLKPVRVGQWAGWVWITMDPEAEPLADFLAPIPEHIDKFEFDKMRYRWYKTIKVPCNWKLVLELFNEFYHVQQTHPQLLAFTDDYSHSGGFGRHGKMWFVSEGSVPLKRSPRLSPKDEPDFRNLVLDFVEKYNTELKALVTERNYNAAQRLRTEVAADASPQEVVAKWFEFQVEAALEEGAGWPMELTPEYIEQSGLDWHIFPNTIFLHMPDGVLWYRARPDGNDPGKCIFDIWSLQRYGPGKEPPLVREFYNSPDEGEWPRIYAQDFANIPEIYKGMQSRSFEALRTNPVQERAIVNFHQSLRQFLIDGEASLSE